MSITRCSSTDRRHLAESRRAFHYRACARSCAGNRNAARAGARLGVAEAQAVQGQYDAAINTYKEMAQRKDGPLPVDGILMQLGRTYLDAGKQSDAQQTFNRLVEEFPDSPFTADAKRALDSLKKT